MDLARQSRNRIVLVVVLVLVIEDPIVEDEDENEDENACRTGVNLHSCSMDVTGGSGANGGERGGWLHLTRILDRPHAVAQVSNLLYRRASSLLVFRAFPRAQNRLQPCRLEIGDQPRKLSGYTGWKPALQRAAGPK